MGDGSSVRHFAVVTNRNDPEGGSGLDLIQWHRKKAGTIEHAHDVLMNELAGWCLPSQKFGADAAWLRMNVLLYNLLSAFKRVGLRKCTMPGRRSGCAFSSSIRSDGLSATPARLCCAVPPGWHGSSPTRPEWPSAFPAPH